MENRLNDLLIKLSNTGRSCSWSKEMTLRSTKDGTMTGEEYCVTIFHKHSCRVDVQFTDPNLIKIIVDIERFINDKHLDWVLNTQKEPF